MLVTAPLQASRSEIEAALSRKAPWIARKLREVAQLSPPLPPRRYVTGEDWYDLGRPYRLQVHVQPEHPEGVSFRPGELYVTVQSQDRAEAVLKDWWRQRAREVFSSRMPALLAHAATFGLHHSGEFFAPPPCGPAGGR
ncbi:YgjP-like metallopeptidase domain-containing protein [Deinococcus radiophilus]|uniref:YgjP-like metallopeptidase domain-containing protein n=1 Tax=Deinococcus radiophilus TaxID=32062 RepID=UPI002270E85F|nr:YgjP-like metallopeptidase domain-containing protein [Deinococcus radiophilus]